MQALASRSGFYERALAPRRRVRRAGLGDVPGYQGSQPGAYANQAAAQGASSIGIAILGTTPQQGTAYLLNEADYAAGLPPGSIENIANAITSGQDPSQIITSSELAIFAAAAATMGPEAVGVAAAASFTYEFIQFLAGFLQNIIEPTPSQPPPCQQQCGQSNPNCIGNMFFGACGSDPCFALGNAVTAMTCGLDQNTYVPGTWYEYIQTALGKIWQAWMNAAPSGSIPPDDQGGVPDVCWVYGQGKDAVSFANMQMALAFPALLAAWNKTHVPPDVAWPYTPCFQRVQQPWPPNDTSCLYGMNGQTTARVRVSRTDPQTGLVIEGPSGCDPLSVALDTLAKLAGANSNSTITLNINTDFKYGDTSWCAVPCSGVQPPASSFPIHGPLHPLPFPAGIPHPTTTKPSGGGSGAVPWILGLLGLAAVGTAGGIYYYGRAHDLTFAQASRATWDRVRHPFSDGSRSYARR